MSAPLPPPPSVPPDDWAHTPQAVQFAILALQEQVRVLQAQVAELLERLNANSSNSSKPPSSDAPKAGPRRSGDSTGRKQGGQAGHPGKYREVVGAERVTKMVQHFPERCEHCGQGLDEDWSDPEPVIHQVTDIPFTPPEVTEHRQYRRRCLHCRKTTLGKLPSHVPTGSFGPGVQATVAYYSGARRLSRREVERTMLDLHGVEMSLGSVSAIEDKASNALTPSVEEAAEELRKSEVVHQDETGWRESNHKAWLWVAANTVLAVFVIAKSRKSEVSQQMLGQFKGFLVSDRFKGYLWYEMARRAICWAHLKRDFQRMVDRGGKSKEIGLKLLAEQQRLFEAWHAFKNGPLDWNSFHNRVKPIRARMMRWLRDGERCGESKTSGACKDMIHHFPAFWTFVYEEGVEPTNNHAEQIVRKPVLWRKGSFGTQSARGSRFVERILTVVESCRLQGRCAFKFLVETLQAVLRGDRPPSLLALETTRIQV